VSHFRRQLEPALRALTLPSETSYAWFGRRSRPLPREVRRALAPQQAREHVVGRVADELYRSFYVHGSAVPANPEGARASSRSPAFGQALSTANCGAGGKDGGWRVLTAEERHATIARWGARVRVRLDDLGVGGVTAGDAVDMPRPKEYRNRAPGFYIAISDADRPADGPQVDARVYFHVARPAPWPSCLR
jgi:hypothetical protein